MYIIKLSNETVNSIKQEIEKEGKVKLFITSKKEGLNITINSLKDTLQVTPFAQTSLEHTIMSAIQDSLKDPEKIDEWGQILYASLQKLELDIELPEVKNAIKKFSYKYDLAKKRINKL